MLEPEVSWAAKESPPQACKRENGSAMTELPSIVQTPDQISFEHIQPRTVERCYRKIMGVKMLRNAVSLFYRLLWNPGVIITRSCSIGLTLVLLFLTGCGADGEQQPLSPVSGNGALVSLVWDSVNEPGIVGYYIHYGKQSPNAPGSCEYDQTIFVLSPQGIVTGLDPGSMYYFAVNAYNGALGPCSNEVQTQT